MTDDQHTSAPDAPAHQSHADIPGEGLIQVAWRMRGPDGRLVQCDIYRTAFDFETRVVYPPDGLVGYWRASSLAVAREHADDLRAAFAADPHYAAIEAE